MIELDLVAEPWLECTRRGAPQGGLGKIRNRNRNPTRTQEQERSSFFNFMSDGDVRKCAARAAALVSSGDFFAFAPKVLSHCVALALLLSSPLSSNLSARE